MSYLFATDDQQREMLRTIGVDSVGALFQQQIPDSLRLHRDLKLPPALTEPELESHMRGLASRSTAAAQVCFAGGGAYDHFIPAAVDAVAGRSEFYTAYTPYQAEASQGSLQAFFEYQTLICQLTGLDVANASLYEGGTAVSEAVFMAMRVTDRHHKVVVLGSVNPHYRGVLETYLRQIRCELVTIPCTNGAADVQRVKEAVDDRTACVVVQQPNFEGCLEQVADISAAARAVGALSVLSFDPISLGLLKRPAELGVDIAVAEGQSLGIPLQYGGPYLGVMACRDVFVRKMPGRLIGETVDRNGKRCFVLNLQAREQHIRREKATSNICTNQGLMALRATVYLSLLGPQGLKDVATLCLQKSHYAAEQLEQKAGLKRASSQPFFKEFAIAVPTGSRVVEQAARAGFLIGPQEASHVLIAVTEKRTKAEIDALVEALTSGAGL